MPDNDSLGIPNMPFATVGFGYIDLAVCDSCYKPNHIFVDSENQRYYCLKCHEHYRSSHNGLPVLMPNAENYPILAMVLPICNSCELPELAGEPGWRLVLAELADRSEIAVHYSCSRALCDKCSTRFAYPGNRYWRPRQEGYAIAPELFANTISIEGEAHCDSCAKEFWAEHDEDDYFECDHCSSAYHTDYSGWFDGVRYCSSCIDENVFSCGNCDELVWDNGDHDCPEEDDDSSLIHSYSYRPSPFFYGAGQYHFGFELEVEARGNGRYTGAQIAQNSLGGRAYLKEDGSLNDGFEIVTHPHTLENYHKEFNWEVLEKLQREGYRSWNTHTCGLHVHVSRTAFGDARDAWSYGISDRLRSQLILRKQAHELRFMKLVYDNQRQVERIAGRSGNQYATFQDKGKLLRKIRDGVQESGRYSAINTDNDSTLEVRVFKGSLRKERVLSAIEFVHAAVEYTRDIKVTSKNHALSWLKFTGYVSANAETYPNLVTIMSESFAGDTNPTSDN